jgi:hypothetical protein
MKKTGRSLVQLLTAKTKIFFVIIVIACNKPETEAESETANHQRELKYASSITVVNGAYRIDTNLVFANRNKKTLVAALEEEKLVDKNTVLEIPDFIKTFFAAISDETEFSMANPGEKYQVGWFDLGKGVPTKQLIYFGIGKNIALFSYYSGGIRRYQRLAIIKFEGTKIVDFWFDNYDVSAKTKQEMIEYLKDNRTRNGKC